jgi:hypothetical protein
MEVFPSFTAAITIYSSTKSDSDDRVCWQQFWRLAAKSAIDLDSIAEKSVRRVD